MIEFFVYLKKEREMKDMFNAIFLPLRFQADRIAIASLLTFIYANPATST